MKRGILLLAFVLHFLVGTVLASSGGPYILDWFRIGGSGGTMSGSTFSLVGTIGQAEAGKLSGGSYSLAGGFLGEAGASLNVYLPLMIKN